jgi:hypothetical protein
MPSHRSMFKHRQEGWLEAVAEGKRSPYKECMYRQAHCTICVCLNSSCAMIVEKEKADYHAALQKQDDARMVRSAQCSHSLSPLHVCSCRRGERMHDLLLLKEVAAALVARRQQSDERDVAAALRRRASCRKRTQTSKHS